MLDHCGKDFEAGIETSLLATGTQSLATVADFPFVPQSPAPIDPDAPRGVA